MKKPSVAFLSALVLLAAATTPLFAQNSEEISGKAAEQAGKLREALTHYVAALQSVPEASADDQRLRETIIKLVQKLSPPPAVPEEARRFSVRGQIAVKEAKSPSDFDEAAKEFGKALRVAPWWADGYINQGVALEKAGKFSEATRSLKFYLLAASNAPDAQSVRDQIYALEYRQEKAQKETIAEKEEQERKRRAGEAKAADFVEGLPGKWIRADNRAYGYEVTVHGRSIEIIFNRSYSEGRWHVINSGESWKGTVDGLNISGTWNGDFSNSWSNATPMSRPMTGTISADGAKIHLDYDAVGVGTAITWPTSRSRGTFAGTIERPGLKLDLVRE